MIQKLCPTRIEGVEKMVTKEQIENLLKEMVEVKGYKYPLSVSSYSYYYDPCKIDVDEVIDEINALTGKHFRLPTKEEMRYIISDASQVAGSLYKSNHYIYEVCKINGNVVLINPCTGKLANDVYIAPMRGQKWWRPTPRCYRLVESDFVPENTEDTEYDELLKRQEEDQAYQDEMDKLYAEWDH